MFVKSLSALISFAALVSSNPVLEALGTVENLKTIKSVLASDTFAGLTKGAPFNGAFTFFAPSDDAFDRAGDLGQDNELITAILTYHVLNMTISSSAITESPAFVPTVSANPKYVNLPNKTPQLLGVFKACDGVKVIDGTYNEGIAYPKVIKADIKVGNGVVHIIDKLLTLPVAPTTVLKANPRYAALYSALSKTNSLNALDSLTGATLFAPSSAAFAIPAILKTKCGPTVAELTKTLYRHVVPAQNLYSSKISADAKIYPTLNKDETLKVNIRTDGSVAAGDATVLQANVLTSNGVIHRINKIITST